VVPTPRFASQRSHKYAQLNARAVQTDLEQNHGRKVARSYIQHVAEWVGNIAAAKEEDWAYDLPRLDAGIATVVVSLDGAMIPMADSDGYREAMVGALSFYNHDGERQHTIYLSPPRPSTANTPSPSARHMRGRARSPVPSSTIPTHAGSASPTAQRATGPSSSSTPSAS
jgi:hypothetical protein